MEKPAGISSEAVAAKTGKAWPEWLAVLDRAGAAAMEHKQIVRYLRERHGIGSWWGQMVTVGYEQARGRRAPNQRTGGFAAGVSRTVGVPVEQLYAAWSDAQIRKKWLHAKVTLRSASPNKSMRIAWNDGSLVEVGFFVKGPSKSQVTVDQTKLPDAAARDAAKEFWAAAMDRLKAVLAD